MKKITSAVLAGVLALGAVVGSASAANADGWASTGPVKPKGYISGCDWCSYWFAAQDNKSWIGHFNNWFRK